MAKACAADKHLQALPGEAVPADFTSQGDALVWLDAERPNLVATVTEASHTGLDQVACDLSIALGHYFYRRRRFDDWLAGLEIARAVAAQIPDPNREGNSLIQLGWALQGSGVFPTYEGLTRYGRMGR